MNFSPFILLNIWSFKKEIFYVSLTFIGVLLLPFIAVLVIAHTGIQLVSDQLIGINATTHQIEIHDPSGKVVATIDVATVWPTTGVITLEFGESDLPYQPFHTGIDIAGKTGDPITPFMKGKVIYADEISWGFGKHITIDHGNNITSTYAHLSKINVKKDDEVKPGDVIGLEGSTGWSTGPHLHFQINVFGIPVNPRVFLGSTIIQ
jgi:murein DD-endopeptidase MepM/ murein hydrolase activator NlpD